MARVTDRTDGSALATTVLELEMSVPPSWFRTDDI